MLLKQSFLLGCDDIALCLFFGILLAPLLPFLLSLCAVDSELLLPKVFDVSLMLQFAHASLLGIHLFEPLVLGELLSHLDLELLLHATLFGLSLCLELQLVVFGGLQLLELSEALRLSLTLGTSCAFLHLLNLKLVT